MGQILNLEILKGDTLLANAYYHWAGYTSSSIELARYITNSIKNIIAEEITKDNNEVLFAIRTLELTGAGLTENEVEHWKDKDVKFKECDGRNEGLISISPNAMENTRYWEEARVQIDIENKKVKFDAVRLYKTAEEIKEYLEESEENIDNLSTYDINNFEFTYDEFDKFSEDVLNMIADKTYSFINKDKTLICSFIE